MHIFVCLDSNGGMCFHHRRQSRDRTVLADMTQTVGQGRLLICDFSAELFQATAITPEIRPDFLSAAGAEDFCFVENEPLRPHIDAIRSITVYCWNRIYPADIFLDLKLRATPWHLQASTEFPGYSHKKITREVYCK